MHAQALIGILYIALWGASFGIAWILGTRTGRRYDALVLAGILGVLGLLIFVTTLVLDSRSARRVTW